MFTSSFSRLFALGSALACLNVVPAVPVVHTRRDNLIPSGPKFVIYTDAALSDGSVLPALADIQGFNVINLSFLQTDGPHDQVLNWANLDATTRQQLKQQYNAAGVSLVASVFGQNDAPTSQGLDPTQLAGTMSQFILNNNLDGIDVDWEETAIMGDAKQNGTGEAWLSAFTQGLRTSLPQGQFILTHAPLGPFFEPNGFSDPAGGYRLVDKNVGSMIDWYNIQFYNADPSPAYNDCNTLITSAGGSALMEIIAGGIDQSKLVIGKPGTPADVGQKTQGGFIDPATLNTCIQTAVSQGWNAGVMAFQFPHADASWLSTVKGSSFN